MGSSSICYVASFSGIGAISGIAATSRVACIAVVVYFIDSIVALCVASFRGSIFLDGHLRIATGRTIAVYAVLDEVIIAGSCWRRMHHWFIIRLVLISILVVIGYPIF